MIFHGHYFFQEIPENGADIAHLNAIHAPSLLGGSDLRYYEKAWHSFARHTWHATWRQHTANGEEHIGTMSLDHDVKLFNKFSFISMKVNARQVRYFSEAVFKINKHQFKS